MWHRRRPFDAARIIGALTLVVGMLWVMAPGAGARLKSGCVVSNETTQVRYHTGGGSSLQAAIDGASAGDSLRFHGVCVGNYTIAKDLTLIGVTRDGWPGPTLDGNDSGTVLTVSGSSVRLNHVRVRRGDGGYGGGIWSSGTLSLTHGSSVRGNSAASYGGGIFNTGTLRLRDTSSVGRNTAYRGGGIYTDQGGTTTLRGFSSVSGNTAEFAGGIVSYGVLTMDGSSSVSGNTTRVGAGGILNYSTLTMNGSSSVSGNITTAVRVRAHGGGIFNFGTVTMNDSSSVSGNTVPVGQGGGVYTVGDEVSLHGSASVSGNTASAGGGIFTWFSRITLSDSSSVSGNAATRGAGGGTYGCDPVIGATDANVFNNQPDDVYIADCSDWSPVALSRPSPRLNHEASPSPGPRP